MLIRNFIIGIDPGLQGAIAVYDVNKKVLHSVYDMPTMPNPFIKGRNQVDPVAFEKIMSKYMANTNVLVQEMPTSQPNDGPVQAFAFGYGVGIILGIGVSLAAKTKTKFLGPNPSSWKSVMGLNSDKAHSLAVAREYFPDHASAIFNLKKHDGRAEAALLCLFAEKYAP